MTTTTPHDDVRWSLTTLFSGPQGAAYGAARADLTTRTADLQAFADAHDLGAGAPLPASDAVRATLAELLERQNALAEELGDVSGYLSGFDRRRPRPGRAPPAHVGAEAARLLGAAQLLQLPGLRPGAQGRTKTSVTGADEGPPSSGTTAPPTRSARCATTW